MNNTSNKKRNNATANTPTNTSANILNAPNVNTTTPSNNTTTPSNNTTTPSNNTTTPFNNTTTPSNNTSNTSNTRNTSNNTKKSSSNTGITNKIGDTYNTIKGTISNSIGAVNDKIGDISDTIGDTIGDKVDSVKKTISEKTGIDIPTPSEDSIMWTILKTILYIIIFVTILWVIKYFYTAYESSIINSPFLLSGTKNAKHGLVISQDPKNTNYIPILPSEGRDGVEFSYSFWIEIEDFTYKNGQWKHVFHKGNASSYPNRAPGVWIHPNSNALRVYMNTQEQILEYVDIDNIPTRKWLHVVLVLRNKILDVYVNGYLKVRKELSSIPRQNNGDFWVNMFGGFEGYLSNIQYFNQAVTFNTIQTLMKSGPSSDNCMDTGEAPPYMDNNWWFTTKS